MRNRLVIGTRKSALALWQSNYIKSEIERFFPGIVVELKHVVTKGDKTQDSVAPIPEIGGKGLFTAELEECLVSKEIDLAVHSLKDLPTVLGGEFVLGAVPKRAATEDVLISRSGSFLRDLPPGASVGTSSVRRSSQLLRVRPDLKIEHIRGNIDTRISKAHQENGIFDAIILARAGLTRLGMENQITEIISPMDILPAPGQGALGVECRANDNELLEMLRVLHDFETTAAVNAEREFLSRLGAGCNTPVAALASVENFNGASEIVFYGRCLSPNGSKLIETRGRAAPEDAQQLGRKMAEEALDGGFRDL